MEICGLPGLLHLYPLSCLSLREWRDDWPEFQTTALFTFSDSCIEVSFLFWGKSETSG